MRKSIPYIVYYFCNSSNRNLLKIEAQSRIEARYKLGQIVNKGFTNL